MDMALMNAFASAGRLPTDDPGWRAMACRLPLLPLLLALVGRLAGLRTELAYPLALVYVFAAAAALAGALVASLVNAVRSERAGEAAATPEADPALSELTAADTCAEEATDGYEVADADGLAAALSADGAAEGLAGPAFTAAPSSFPLLPAIWARSS